jgi:SNF2 family DNA or RNA helicase
MTLPSKTTPWAHQAKELELWESEARALLWQMRTGKTKVVIDTLGGWFLHKGLRSVIVVAPKGVHDNWVREEFPTHADYPYAAIAWYAHKRNRVPDTEGLLVFAVGKETLLTPAAKKAIKMILRRGPCALIADESHHFGRPGAKRTRSINGLARRCVMRRILSGTPTGNSPLKLYSQFNILSHGALGYTRFSAFEARYALLQERRDRRTQRAYQQIVGYQNLDELQTKLTQYASVVLREDCEDLPDLIHTKQYYELSDAQRTAYAQMRDDLIVELDSGLSAEAVNPGVKLIRLQQILSNFCVNEAFETEVIDANSDPRLDALMESIDGPTIVWCRYRECIRRVIARLDEEGIPNVEYHGGVPTAKRQEALQSFREGRAQVFVGQPACAGEGLNLSTAQTIVWYSHVFDSVSREQASERATRVGGHSVAVIDIVAPNTVDGYILDCLDRKQSIADRLTGSELRDILAKMEV